MSEHKRDLSNLLWSDLVTDEERLDFLRLGMAVKMGLVAPAIADEAYRAFHFLYTSGPGYAPDSCNYFTPSVALVRHKPTDKVYIYIMRGPMSGYKHYWAQEYDKTKCVWLKEDECERYYGDDQQYREMHKQQEGGEG